MIDFLVSLPQTSIMKKTTFILSLFCAIFLISCQTQQNMTQQKTKNVGFTNQNGMLVGQITEADLLTTPFNKWYELNYQYHKPNTEVINAFKKQLKGFDIEIFMGTWCPDSHRETPGFIKILKTADYPMDKMSMYAVDRSKKSGVGAETGKDISHVPTFIFYKKGKEVGRIVESPINSLEEDIYDIVKGTPQTPNYN